MNKTPLTDKSILLIISGGIAAYKALELIRLLRKDGASVRCILTKGGAQFVTPMSVAAISEHPAYTDLWSLKDEAEMGHIRLSREADLIVIAPASADLLARMAHGLADDLATTTLLAADKPVLIAPAMNHRMWDHPATQVNLKLLEQRGARRCGPEEGDMACGEHGMGRMAEPAVILEDINRFFFDRPLEGKHVVVTAGPTHEPIDPVRFIANRSSGKQGYAIAAALAEAGARVTLISGPVALHAPPGVTKISVETATEMLAACEAALPADIFIAAAAVGDWRISGASDVKIKKDEGSAPPALALTENPDILKSISRHTKRPALVIGFAAETEDLLANARRKLESKGCDWIIANDVGGGAVFGADENRITLLRVETQDPWPVMSKTALARRLVGEIVQHAY